MSADDSTAAWTRLQREDGAPGHADEVMAAHEGQPTVAEQDRTHGAGLPDADYGADDRTKYGQ